jgi:pimeloyl-ACP methyl ester carboxylesterase
LDTFIDDLTNLFEMEELQNVVLVGHSFGGSPISGVADRMPDRIYLDAAVLQGGQSPRSEFRKITRRRPGSAAA